LATRFLGVFSSARSPPAESLKAGVIAVVRDPFTSVLYCQRGMPSVGHEIPNGSALFEASDEEVPMARAGRDYHGVGRSAHRRDVCPRDLRRRRRVEDSRMRENAKGAAENEIAQPEWLRGASKSFNVSLDFAMPRRILAHCRHEDVDVE